MGDTLIEWTEARSSVKAGYHHLYCREHAVRKTTFAFEDIEPFLELHVALTAVARTASGNHVAGGRPASTGYWVEMVDRIGSTLAVEAHVAVKLREVLKPFGRNSSNVPLSNVRSIRSLEAYEGVRRVMLARDLIAVRLAVSGSNCVDRQPRLASCTPRATQRPACSTFSSRRSARAHSLVRREAGRRETITSRRITSELGSSLPHRASAAPLVARENTNRVLGDGDPEPRRRGAKGAMSITSHRGAA